jgi:hypothetical protein
MSETPVVESSAVIDRANRLMSLRSNPGYPDAWQISKQMADDAGRISITYPGWDPQQIIVLKVRAQAALEHHEAYFANIQAAIREGIQAQATAANLHEKTPGEVLETGDYVRQEVLTRFAEMDTDGRLPGTY